MKKTLLLTGMGLAALLSSGLAQAAACGSGAMATTDVTINSFEANDCFQGGTANQGNDPQKTWAIDGSPSFEPSWGTFLYVGTQNAGTQQGPQSTSISDGVNSGSLTFGSIPSPLSGASGSGEWFLSWTGGPWELDLVFVVKQGNSYGAYLFDGLDLSPANSSYQNGAWRVAISGVSTSGVSHLSLYYANPEGRRPPDEIPEPAPLALMAVALAGIVALRRRGKGRRGA